MTTSVFRLPAVLQRPLLPEFKARLHARNERDQLLMGARAAARDPGDGRKAREALAALVAQASAEGARLATERIAAAILAATPPPKAHLCPEGPWCCGYCERVHQARRDAAIARGVTCS